MFDASVVRNATFPVVFRLVFAGFAAFGVAIGYVAFCDRFGGRGNRGQTAERTPMRRAVSSQSARVGDMRPLPGRRQTECTRFRALLNWREYVPARRDGRPVSASSRRAKIPAWTSKLGFEELSGELFEVVARFEHAAVDISCR